MFLQIQKILQGMINGRCIKRPKRLPERNSQFTEKLRPLGGSKMDPVVFVRQGTGAVAVRLAGREEDPASLHRYKASAELCFGLRAVMDRHIERKSGPIDAQRLAMNKTITALQNMEHGSPSL